MTALDSQHQLDSRQLHLSQRLSALGLRSPGAAFEHQRLQALLQRSRNAKPAVARRLLERVEAGIAHLDGQPVTDDRGSDSASAALAAMANTRQALAQLRLALAGDGQPEEAGAASFAEALAAQDKAGFAADRPLRDPGGLQAARNLAALQTQYQLDQLLVTALLDQPEAPGPLNPQGLLIRALKTLHGVSPAYLTRFVNYSRTLLWLQRAADRAESGKPGKGRG